MKFIRKIIRKILKPFTKRIKKAFKRYGKKILIGYLLSVLPAGYGLTGILTGQLGNPVSNISTLISGGLLNIVTAGLYEPISLKVGEISASLNNSINGGTSEAQAQLQKAQDNLSAYFNSATKKVSETVGETVKTDNSNLDTVSLVDGTVISLPKWDNNLYPDYYLSLGQANVDVNQFPEKGKINYSSIDDKGRTQTATATLTRDNYVASLGRREDFKAGSEPSGWYMPNTRTTNNIKVSVSFGNGRIYNGCGYNRSHLIGDAIGGNAIKENAITGTRTQNVGTGDGGMRYTEKQVEKYFKEGHENNVVYYRNQPIYLNENIIAMGNVVWVQSDDGVLNEKVYVFNSMNGYLINRNTGELVRQ